MTALLLTALPPAAYALALIYALIFSMVSDDGMDRLIDFWIKTFGESELSSLAFVLWCNLLITGPMMALAYIGHTLSLLLA